MITGGGRVAARGSPRILNGIEAHVGREDEAGIDDLALGQLVEGALDLRLGIAVGALDVEVLALQLHLVARGVHE